MARSDANTRRQILDILKAEGACTVADLAARFGLSDMAVRLHLKDLGAEGLVTYAEERRPKGRPVKRWALTRRADAEFPDSHAELTVGLLRAMEDAFGADGLERMLAVRAAQLEAGYRREIDAGDNLDERLETLARLRSAEGYMADVEREADGSRLLLENHCPICVAASACQGLCRIEQQVFQAVLGPEVTVERIEHIPAGARRCAYRIRPSIRPIES
jgi:predicted ArsR family transcriptional regulator